MHIARHFYNVRSRVYHHARSVLDSRYWFTHVRFQLRESIILRFKHMKSLAVMNAILFHLVFVPLFVVYFIGKILKPIFYFIRCIFCCVVVRLVDEFSFAMLHFLSSRVLRKNKESINRVGLNRTILDDDYEDDISTVHQACEPPSPGSLVKTLARSFGKDFNLSVFLCSHTSFLNFIFSNRVFANYFKTHNSYSAPPGNRDLA